MVVKSAPANFSFSDFIPFITGIANKSEYVFSYISNILYTNLDDSSLLTWAVCPSYHKNSQVLINGVGCLNSHLTILVH